MRDHIVLYVNGQRCEAAGADVFLSLADFLRRRQGLVGVKIVCSEGDCGSCTVLLGRLVSAGQQVADHEPRHLTYRPIDSCIQFVWQLDGTHVITVEGLAAEGALSPVQQAMIDCHGSQCGFCTPGFVMSMAGLVAAAPPPDAPSWSRGLTGNLCRCTGYVPILEAGALASECGPQPLSSRYPEVTMCADFERLPKEPLEVSATIAGNNTLRRVLCPVDLEAVLGDLARYPHAVLVAGATDLGVRINKTGKLPEVLIDLNRVRALADVRCEAGEVVAGAGASWTSLAEFFREVTPQFAQLLDRFGSPQIRHVGTLGGNLANASPIADSLPLLYVLEARVVVRSAQGQREIPIDTFYRGYKQIDLRPGELIVAVRIPLPTADQRLRLYKVSRRCDMDIASFTAAVLMTRAGETITAARIAMGAVGPTVLRAARAEQVLRGAPFNEASFAAAAIAAAQEVTPISDVRGSADYRRSLAHNVLLKFFYQENQADRGASCPA